VTAAVEGGSTHPPADPRGLHARTTAAVDHQGPHRNPNAEPAPAVAWAGMLSAALEVRLRRDLIREWTGVRIV
jgi:hypothetical protein